MMSYIDRLRDLKSVRRTLRASMAPRHCLFCSTSAAAARM